MKRFIVWGFAAIGLGCSASGDSDAPTDATAGSTEETASGFDVGSMESTPVDTNCAAVESKAMIVKRPIDFIVLPDESPSMGTTRDAIANAMQDQVKKALDAAGVDYHVVWHGSWPLPGLAGKLTYNKVNLGSGDDGMFKPVLDSFDAWTPVLRADALKVFVHFTDATAGQGSNITGYTGQFDDLLFMKSPTLFGSATDRKLTYHAFIGLKVNTPAEKPYLPADAIVGATCASKFVDALPLEQMAKRNNGYRFPLCRDDLFGGVFDLIAKSAIEGAALPCELIIPDPPTGEKLDLSTVAVRFKDGSKEEVFLRAKDMSECKDNRFLLDEATRRVTLCAAEIGRAHV